MLAGTFAPPQAGAQTLAAALPVPGFPGAAAGGLADAAPNPGVETDGTLEATAKRTRFVIGLDKRVKYSVFALSNPNRVIVEMGDARIDLPDTLGDRPIGLVKSFRGGLSAPGRQRVVIDVTTPVVVDRQVVTASPDGRGYQLALDIMPVSAAMGRAKLASLGSAPSRLGVQPPLPRPAEAPDKRAARAFKPIIVIDPGHGGHDSGATKNGTIEKDVVLAFSQVLKDQLEATGRYKVLMTRETDVFVELDARRAFGERHNASLFIAVHADYASTRARGATIYSLRDGVAEQLKRSAKGEAAEQVLSKQEISAVRSASNDGDVIKNILADLARREVSVTQERTSMFSRSVVANMSSSTNMRDDPDKQAAFRVLKTAQFPSVLIELAYVSNRKDAALLKSDEWRGKVAGSITKAVDNYFSHQLARLPL
ncbi:MAG: N-acetylmuramoyl-L-alanine amidase [Hyphomicrobiaceae bacterium]|nr:N-acetylmuramoyl-L-alanine amidase [Hyphomicrobiaceae bacterium]